MYIYNHAHECLWKIILSCYTTCMLLCQLAMHTYTFSCNVVHKQYFGPPGRRDKNCPWQNMYRAYMKPMRYIIQHSMAGADWSKYHLSSAISILWYHDHFIWLYRRENAIPYFNWTVHPIIQITYNNWNSVHSLNHAMGLPQVQIYL